MLYQESTRKEWSIELGQYGRELQLDLEVVLPRDFAICSFSSFSCYWVLF